MLYCFVWARNSPLFACAVTSAVITPCCLSPNRQTLSCCSSFVVTSSTTKSRLSSSAWAQSSRWNLGARTDPRCLKIIHAALSCYSSLLTTSTSIWPSEFLSDTPRLPRCLPKDVSRNPPVPRQLAPSPLHKPAQPNALLPPPPSPSYRPPHVPSPPPWPRQICK